MRISQLYVYPIKSLRPCVLSQAQLTIHGFEHDRRFMLLKIHDDGNYENMHVSSFSEMVLFHTKLITSLQSTEESVEVTFKPPNSLASSISIPLRPEVRDLKSIHITMHESTTAAYEMDDTACAWFSKCFGYPVILAYLGEHYREVLMTTSMSQSRPSTGWLRSIGAMTTALTGRPAKERITFADCAPYLIISERSVDDVHRRLPDGELMDVTKFRANIVISGADEPWDEDYWRELTINEGTKIDCLHNCVRCVSLNVDYATGKPGIGPSGKVLAKLQKDRRVDPGSKYSPVFGRYSFLSQASAGHTIRVGDRVTISRRNEKRTLFDWPGLATT